MYSMADIILDGMKNNSLSRIVKVKHKEQPIIKAMIWFRVKDDANNPMEHYDAARKIAPIYPPRTGPASTSPIKEIKIG